ncbi:MAG: Pimeloyl-ACP methyl ester carboxylesterase [Rhodobacteraceae bacterium HLUCCA24]|nr:MAG: Pimeloyl-ACP methyl ester carboxylesterase [Rhodobacteraceae bacterium HLUCCA24]
MPRFTTSDGLSLFYLDEGRGLPVLCLTGLTRNTTDFDYLAPHLAGRVRLIRMDYRGRGRSDWAEDHLSYTVPREGADAVELLDHLGLDTAAVIGTSRGGLISLVLAATAKERLRGVMLNDIGPVLEPAGLEVILGYLGRDPVWKTVAEAMAERPRVMAGFANVPESRWREEIDHLYHVLPEGLRINYDPRLREAVIEAGAQGAADLWPYFDALDGLPVGVIRGANSDLLSRATVEEMRRRRPDLIAAEVPDRGHIPFLDEAEALDAIHAWLERLA